MNNKGRLACALLALALASAALAAESVSPHRMVKADGTPDMDKCAVCHNADLSLARPKRETCTFCHGETPHSGAAEHLRVKPAELGRLRGAQPEGQTKLPLREDGGIYCGTCHLFHDPEISGEHLMAAPQLPNSKGLARAVKDGRAKKFEEIRERYGMAGKGAEFTAKGTRTLRLPTAEGQLCKACHRSVR